VVKSRGQPCGDIELAGYLANATGPVSLVLDLRVAHDRVDSSADPALNGHLRYPNNLDKSLNDTAADKIRKYRSDYNNNPPSAVAFMPAGKLTAFLQLQEFCQRNHIVDSSTTAARLFLLYSNLKLETFSPRLLLYVLILT